MQQLQCMEIWGGNQHAEECIQLAGIDAWVYSRPHEDATDGGDVHYLSSCATGRITRLLLADVSGHGQSVATIAGHLRTLMRRYVNYINQNRFLAELNQEFMQRASQGRFATALAMTYFAPTNELAVCNAGHPRPIIYRAATGKWSLMLETDTADGEAINIPLGITDEAQYRPYQVQLACGDRLLCYTDSLIETRCADASFLGEQALCDILNTVMLHDDANIIAELLQRIEQHTGNAPTDDDLTVMLVKPTVISYKVPLAQRLRAPWLLVKGIVKAVRRSDYPLPATEMTLRNIGGALFDALNRSRF